MSKTHAYFGDASFPEATQKKQPKSIMSVTQLVDYTHTPEELISKHLESNGQTMAWLARKVNLSRTHLHNIIRSPEPWKKRLTPELRRQINDVLKTNY